ncbi:MAG: hypothetical protein OSA47_02235 [Novosphingopyxis baekryungensis]|nr:hypothetical protein [Novosphingopyxis baekryungensis]
MIQKFAASATLYATLILAPSQLRAQDIPAQRVPEQLSSAFACQTIRSDEERLACYDERVALLEAAASNKDVIVADKETLRETKRGLFGFSLPKIDLFSNDGSDQDFEEIESTIQSARKIGYGYWLMELETGARWEQVDGKLVLSPKNGQKVKIRRGSLGTYFARVNGQPGVRVRRVE